MELGKDVVSVDPDDRPCAFQLKGHPGGRLTLNELRDITPQLHHLTDLAMPYPDLSGSPHRSFLVTNGLVEEEAIHAINAMNEAYERDGLPNRRIEVIQRGDLLAMAKRLGHSLWPTEIPQVHLLLQMLVEDGRNMFPLERGNSMLVQMLGLSSGRRPKWSAAEVRRRITSAALLTSLSLKNFEASDNHVAKIAAWVQFAVSAIGATERFGLNFQRNAEAAVVIAETAIRDALMDLANEAAERRVFVEGDVVADSPFYRARYTLVLGLVSLLWLWLEESGWPDGMDREDVERFLDEGEDELYLWGEAAIPQLLAYYWYTRRRKADASVDRLLMALVASTSVSSDPDREGLASPYWDFEAVARHQLSPILGVAQDPMARESTGFSSFFVESLLHQMVRTNWKEACRQLWPDVSRSHFVEFRPRYRWQYCLLHSEEGEYRQTLPPSRKTWTELVEEASSIRDEFSPGPLQNRPVLHALYVLLFPYRGAAGVIRRLARHFNRTWLLSKDPVE
jgi:hypothetical protein